MKSPVSMPPWSIATIETSLKAPAWNLRYIKVPAKIAAAAPITSRIKVESFIMNLLKADIFGASATA